MRDYTDSEEDGLLAGGLPCIEELPHEESQAMEVAPSGSQERDEPPLTPYSSELRRPIHLAPINTNVCFDSPPGAYRPKSKSSRDEKTPTKKVRTSSPRRNEEALLGALHIQRHQSCPSPQPPFNTGVLSIFSPHSLTVEPSPFFLQSALPASARLPPIRTLLQSELANPFSAYIPTPLHSELPKVQVSIPSEVAPHVHRAAVPDPAPGYGFTFGNTVWVGPPPKEHEPVSQSPPPAAQVITPGLEAVGQVSNGAYSGFVSTPNIDRACHYLWQR